MLMFADISMPLPPRLFIRLFPCCRVIIAAFHIIFCRRDFRRFLRDYFRFIAAFAVILFMIDITAAFRLSCF